MINDTCRLYKTCKICGQTKWYKSFTSKGGEKEGRTVNPVKIAKIK
ncbi:hypothetical protein PspKH34_35710 [Parageobacillus sp. KH3-4]|jgi:hypothetical protein|nr:hypothetical protein PspKH34_35710 [Parageobacillus sp. KH3-4]